MDAQSNGDGELHNREPAAQAKVDRALKALESSKDVFAQELSRLRALNESIPMKQSNQTIEEPVEGAKELPPCPTLLQNLWQEREILSEELQQQKERCEELQSKLEQEHVEKLEAQMCLNILNETVRAALQGEKFLVDRNQHLVLDQQVLSSKLDEVSKTRIPAFQGQIKDLVAACSSMKQNESVGVLHNKVWIRGVCVFAELVLFCHAILWFLSRTLKEAYSFAPT